MEAKKAVLIVAAAFILFMGVLGIGGAAYQMGMREGAFQGAYYSAPAYNAPAPPPPPLAEARPAAPAAQPAPAVEPAYGYRLHNGYAMGYYGEYHRHSWGPFGLIGRLIGGIFHLFLTLLFFAIVFKVLRRIVFGHRGWGMGWHGGPGGPGWHGGPGGPGKWQEKWQAGPPPWVQEWHRKMHETPATTTDTANPANPNPVSPSAVTNSEAKPTEENPSVTKL